MKFIACKSRSEFTDIAGLDWWIIVKVDGGYFGFSTRQEYNTWKKQK